MTPGGLETSRYELLEKLHEGPRSLIYRASAGSGAPVVLKLPRNPHPSDEQLAGLRHELEMLRAVGCPEVIRPLGLEIHKRTQALILEDCPGSQSLRQVLRAEPYRFHQTQSFLALALPLCRAVEALHSAGIIHKRLNPGNILVNGSAKLRLIDLASATRVASERAATLKTGQWDDHLPYISPEQSGRTSTTLDGRSDLYSLGVIFYELLAGAHPFRGKASLELLACHLAVQPPPLPDKVPPALRELVARLLAKSSEDRYQSAWGLRTDLERCALDPETPFPLGQRDLSSTLRVSQKLYGREAESQGLEEAWRRITEAESPGRELVLLGGYSGIGKTSLAWALHTTVTLSSGTMVWGKNEQFVRHTPHAALGRALGQLVRQWLAESESRLSARRARLEEALGVNGRIVADVVPELDLLLGPSAVLSEVGPAEARHRFDRTWVRFLRCCCAPGEPLALFLDDLQWADPASLRLLETLLSDPDPPHWGPLLVIGAYRDNEVDAQHALSQMTERLMGDGLPISRLRLRPLTLPDVLSLLADTLHQPASELRPLAELVQSKTAGNPLFINAFLNSLAAEGLLLFDSKNVRWSWSLDSILQRRSTDNVADLLVGNARKLPSTSQRLLSVAACLGVCFNSSLLADVLEAEPTSLDEHLAPLLDEGMITIEPEHRGQEGREYRFCHDRVQQAARALLSEQESWDWRLRIARRMLGRQSQLSVEQLFSVIGHFDQARTLVTTPPERRQVAELCLSACRHAKAATAYSSARAYLELGLAMADSCPRELDLTLRREMAEVELQTGNIEGCEALVRETLARLGPTVEAIPFYSLLTRRFTVASQYAEARDTARIALKLLGVDLPSDDDAEAEYQRLLPWIRQKLDEYGPRYILDLPLLEDPGQRMVVQLLDLLIPPTYQAGQWELFTWVYLKAVRICLEFGNVPEVGFCYSWYGNLLNFRFAEYRAALTMGQTALELMQRMGQGSQQTKIYLSMGTAQGPWVESFATCQGWFDDCYRVGLECGELHFAGFAKKQQFFHDLHRGRNLNALLGHYDESIGFLKATRNQLAVDVAETTRLLVMQLIHGEVDSATEVELLRDCRQHQSRMALCCYAIMRAQALVHYGDFVGARRSLTEARELLYTIVCFAATATFNFLDSLLVIREDGDLEQVTRNQTQLGAWADSCPDNFRHKHLLVEAELAAMRWDRLRALELYEQAIAMARSGGFLHDEALACELASAFYRNWGKETLSQSYLSEAYHAYRRWGALAKLQDMEALNPGLASNSAHKEASDSLDFDAALRASQVLSGEMDLQRLLTFLLKLVMDCSGARRGVLLLREDAELRVEGEAYADPERIRVLQSLPVTPDMIPELVVNFTLRTGQDILLGDAWRDGDFRRDPYIVEHQSKSILCLPLSRGGKVGGLLYLENSLAVSAFTEDQIRVLHLLAAQASISIVNARLYASMEFKVRERTQAAELAQRAAESASKAKSSFLANMSHEIRTPLNAILGYSQVLRSAPELSPRSRDGLEVIESNGRHLLELIDEVLDLAKIEAGRMELKLGDFDLSGLLKALSRTFALRCQEKGLEWRLECPDLLPRLHGDEQKLRQILLNLLGNAVKFTSHGEVSLKVVHEQDDYTFEVSDTGPGVAPDEKELILEPFRQGTTASDTAGSGLGLAITVRQVELLQGRLELESQPGQGSRFTLRLPLRMASGAPDEVAGESWQLACDQSCFALVADDVLDSRNLLSTVLENLGCRVLQAADGAEAVRLALEYRPDVIWMDIRMPVLDGPAAARQIWDTLGRSAPRIIAVSASAFGHDRDEFLKFGFDAFMAKPYAIEEVPRTLARVLPSLLGPTPEVAEATEGRRLPLRVVASLRTALEMGADDRVLALLAQIEEQGAEADKRSAEKIKAMLPLKDYPAMLGILDEWGL